MSNSPENSIRGARSAYLVPVLAAIVFGLYPGCIQYAYAEGANVSFVIIFTTLARALGMAVFCVFTGRGLLPREEKRWEAVTGGFFQAVSIVGIIGSLQFLPGPVMIVLVFTHTIMLLFYLRYRGEIQLSVLAIASTLGALLGISLVVDVWHNLQNLSILGISLAMMAAFATVVRLYVIGKQTKHTDPAVVGTQTYFVAFLFVLPLWFWHPPLGPGSLPGIVALTGSCLSLILGSFAMFYGIWLAGSFRYSLTAKLEPVFTALFSFLVLGEALSALQYVGILLVTASLVFYQYFQREAAAEVTTPGS